MSEALKALEEVEAALKRADLELTVPAAEYVPAIPAAWDHIKTAMAALVQARIDFRSEADRSYAAGWNASRAALSPAPVGDGKVETVRKRHIRLGSQLGNRSTGLTAFECEVAHQDRATLLSCVDALSEELAKAKQAIKVQASAVKTLQTCEEKEINILRRTANNSHRAIATLDSERAMNEILTNENERLRKALTFYADPANYIGRSDSTSSVYVETSAIDIDNGAQARKEIINK